MPIAAVGVYLLAADVRIVFWAVTLSNVAAALWLTGYFAYSSSQGMLERAAGDGAAAAD